jgi:hypothetical protein
VVIDAWEIPGDIVVRELKKGDPSVASKSIALSVFINEGRHANVVVKHTGWHEWKSTMKQIAVYEIRRKTAETIIKEYASARNLLRCNIRDCREDEKTVNSKLFKFTLYLNRIKREIKETKERIRKNTAAEKKRIIEYQNRKRHIEELIEYRKTISDSFERKGVTSKIGTLRSAQKLAIEAFPRYKEIDKTLRQHMSERNRRRKLLVSIVKNIERVKEEIELDILQNQNKIRAMVLDEEFELQKTSKLREHLIRKRKKK